jgi:hypothetical protein
MSFEECYLKTYGVEVPHNAQFEYDDVRAAWDAGIKAGRQMQHNETAQALYPHLIGGSDDGQFTK